jgi:hypothetical protein
VERKIMIAYKKVLLCIAASIAVLGLVAAYLGGARSVRSGSTARSEAILESFWDNAVREARERRVKLLSQTDHEALLKAGRALLCHVQMIVDPATGSKIYSIPKGVEVPKIIKDILCGRGGISAYDGYLRIAMFGGWDDYGVKVYPEDFTEPKNNFKYGDCKLLDGLWYYDENYRWGQEYDEYVRSLVAKNKASGQKTSEKN